MKTSQKVWGTDEGCGSPTGRINVLHLIKSTCSKNLQKLKYVAIIVEEGRKITTETTTNLVEN